MIRLQFENSEILVIFAQKRTMLPTKLCPVFSIYIFFVFERFGLCLVPNYKVRSFYLERILVKSMKTVWNYCDNTLKRFQLCSLKDFQNFQNDRFFFFIFQTKFSD